METAGACFERCLGQAPAEVLMLGQLEATAMCIVAQREPGALGELLGACAYGFKPQFKAMQSGPRLNAHAVLKSQENSLCTTHHVANFSWPPQPLPPA